MTGLELHNERVSRGLSQRDVALALQWKASATMSMLEKGDTRNNMSRQTYDARFDAAWQHIQNFPLAIPMPLTEIQTRLRQSGINSETLAAKTKIPIAHASHIVNKTTNNKAPLQYYLDSLKKVGNYLVSTDFRLDWLST